MRRTLPEEFSLTQALGTDPSQSLALSLLDRTQTQAASTLLFDARPAGTGPTPASRLGPAESNRLNALVATAEPRYARMLRRFTKTSAEAVVRTRQNPGDARATEGAPPQLPKTPCEGRLTQVSSARTLAGITAGASPWSTFVVPSGAATSRTRCNACGRCSGRTKSPCTVHTAAASCQTLTSSITRCTIARMLSRALPPAAHCLVASPRARVPGPRVGNHQIILPLQALVRKDVEVARLVFQGTCGLGASRGRTMLRTGRAPPDSFLGC